MADKVKMVATMTIADLNVAPGQSFECDEQRALDLEQHGRAKPAPAAKPAAKRDAG